jgi:tRNA modification GTPase
MLGLAGRDCSPRQATLCKFLDSNGATLDHGLLVYFPGPRSYTGEDVLEIQGHGGLIVVQMILARCLELGARIAEPGEFTKRAFLNDKLDLAQAEAVADLIGATTAEAARGALRSLEGVFSDQVNHLIDALTELRALVEATLDFPDEEIDFIQKSRVGERIAGLKDEMASIMEASRQGSLLREGIHVVMAGQPNVGKSSLLNRFAGVERAIVTALPGTTRDTIGETISIDGVPLHLVDTAGLRDSNDLVEQIGISRSHAAIGKADLVLWVADIERPDTRVIDVTLLDRLAPTVPRILVVNKVDLVSDFAAGLDEATSVVGVSAQSGEGIAALKQAVLKAVGWGTGEGVYLARARHIEALRCAATYLDDAGEQLQQIELCAEDLRLAQVALAAITGEVSADDLLGKIFGQFCIGK